jgi:mono/diheme cytochrome c family protein
VNAKKLVALALSAASMTGCSWFTAFVEQPKIDPWEILGSIKTPQRGNPQNSVPITGTFVAGYQVSYSPLPGTIDSMSALKNPVLPSDASLINGRKLFQINCAVCHGEAGKGDSPNAKFGVVSINLTTDLTKNRTDGYIFGMIRNGRGLMPTYDRIEEMDRWDIVNYIRGLQGKLPKPVPTGPVGYPGQTGDALPGYTLTAPTRPFPYYGPNGPVFPDSMRPIQAQPVGGAPQ